MKRPSSFDPIFLSSYSHRIAEIKISTDLCRFLAAMEDEGICESEKWNWIKQPSSDETLRAR